MDWLDFMDETLDEVLLAVLIIALALGCGDCADSANGAPATPPAVELSK